MNLLEKAIGISLKAHIGAVDKAGRPYILHPLHVMMQMETEAEMITAVLHDVLEDSDITLADLEREGFPSPILKALTLLTHDKKRIRYEDYILAIKPNALARRVKLADLAHNMDIRRLPELDRRAVRRLQHYGRAWQRLAK